MPRTEFSAPTRSALLTQRARGGPKRCAPRRIRRTTVEAKLAGARPPREASPAKVASDGQHNDDDDDDPKPGRHVILSSGACRPYDEPTRIRKRVRAYAAMGTARARLDPPANPADLRRDRVCAPYRVGGWIRQRAKERLLRVGRQGCGPTCPAFPRSPLAGTPAERSGCGPRTG